MSRLIGYLGGTFDPIHCGHLAASRELAAQVGLSSVILLPNNVPPHRPQPEASATQRLEMLRLAIRDQPLFSIDDRELHRPTPSWTLTTLKSLRAELGPDRPLGFIIGQDSLLSLDKWFGWQQLLDYCHLLVCRRPGYADRHPEPQMQQWITQHSINDVNQLQQQPAGGIFFANTELHAISATELRRRYQLALPRTGLIDPAVDAYILDNGLYREK